MRKLVFSIFVAVLAASILFVSCSQDPAKPSSYTIKFNANGGTGTMEEMVVSNGDSVALPRGTFTSAEGNQFVGWNTKSDYTGDIYTDEEKFVPQSDLTLYAQWVPKDFFKVVDGELQRGSGFDALALKNNLAIPKYIDGEKVTSFKNGAIGGMGMMSVYGLYQECYHLKAVSIPDSVVSIGDYAFNRCYAMTSVSLPDTITSIGNSSFSECYNLETIDLPEALETIGGSAFSDCHLLDSVLMPDSVKTIGSSAFSNCRSLTTITLPENITVISGYLFDRCTNLKQVTIKGELESIGVLAFRYNSALKSFTIPATVTTIATAAFYTCNGLEALYINASTPPALGNDEVFDNGSDCPIYVPADSVEAYKTAGGYWDEYADRIQAAK